MRMPVHPDVLGYMGTTARGWSVRSAEYWQATVAAEDSRTARAKIVMEFIAAIWQLHLQRRRAFPVDPVRDAVKFMQYVVPLNTLYNYAVQ